MTMHLLEVIMRVMFFFFIPVQKPRSASKSHTLYIKIRTVQK